MPPVAAPPIQPREHVANAACIIHGKLYTGYDHRSAFWQAVEDGTATEHEFLGKDHVEGYVSSTGRWLSRAEALQMGAANGQVRIYRDQNDPEAPWLDAHDLKPVGHYTPDQVNQRFSESLQESSMARLLTLFKTSRVAILSAEISRDTVDRMAEFNRHDFFDQFSMVLGRKVGMVLRDQITDHDIAFYNARATEHLKNCGLPYIKLSGAFSYDGKKTTLEKTLALIGLSNQEAVDLSATYFQQAYIYVNKGIFFYFDSKDHQHYYPAATEQWTDLFPGHIKARNPKLPEPENLHPLPKVGPDVKAGTIVKNKTFLIDFDFDKGADPALTNAIESFQEMNTIFVPKMGHMPLDQAKTELLLWAEKLRMDAESGDFRSAAVAAEKAQAYANVLDLSRGQAA